MILFSLSFLCGILFLQSFSHLPSVGWMMGILFFSILSIVFCIRKKSRYIKFFYGLIAGFFWALFFSYHILSWTLPSEWEGKTVSTVGYVASIPDVSSHGVSFLFSLRELNHKKTSALIKVNWRESLDALHAGEKWKLSLRLKRIHGLMNPNSFDYEAWAFQEGIRASGYVVVKGENKLIQKNTFHYLLAQLREKLKERIEKIIPKTNTSPWIIALVVGERHGISQPNWEILRQTGTNHLMAIAGLHIGFISGFMYALILFLWKRSSYLMLKLPAHHAAVIASLCIAFIYSAMAGFSLPTERACIMLSSFLIASLLKRHILAWQSWSIALFFTLFINPLNVLDSSFWLSFSSVALIIYGMSGRLSIHSIWWKWGRIQWVIALGLLPISIALFQQCSLVSFIANSIAIPLTGFFILPLCLLGSMALFFSNHFGGFILFLADKLLSLLWWILTSFSHLSWSVWYQSIPHMSLIILGCLGVVLLLLPSGLPGRYLGIIWMLPILFYKPELIKSGDVKFTLLDVGQGLSAVVQTQHHILVYDTGAKLGDNFDIGENVIIPFLRAQHIKKIDGLVVSHGDNDHIGGAPAILKQFPVSFIKTSVPEKLPSTHTSLCLRGESWNWDHVNFTFLYPPKEKLGLDNNSSCVLHVTSGNTSILLTGDIEKMAENDLVEYEKENLSSTILIAPHHGSKTSAENNFLEAVHPQYVLFPVGYRNRYHFPHDMVIEKYQRLGVTQYDTAKDGAIQITLSTRHLHLYRLEHWHYWMDFQEFR